MPKKDLFHDLVVEILEDEQWRITHDPFRLRVGKVELLADLGAERLIAAHKGTKKIVVEIKTFNRVSTISAFHEAVGQYRNYQRVLDWKKLDRTLYLAIPNKTYQFFMSELFYKMAIIEDKINLIVFNDATKKIIKWVKN